MITESTNSLNKKLAELFGLEVKNLIRFTLSVESNRAPIIKAVYIGADNPEKILVKSREIVSIDDAID